MELKPIKPIPPPIPTFSATMKKAKKIVQDKEKFGVFVRKQGKDIEVGTYGSLGEAKQKLTGKISGTLRASGYITKGSEKLKASSLGLFGGSYTASKIDKFRVVERKEKRLKLGTTENVEIIGFRKGGKKKGSKSKKTSLFGI